MPTEVLQDVAKTLLGSQRTCTVPTEEGSEEHALH
jgi:hypothetical protein